MATSLHRRLGIGRTPPMVVAGSLGALWGVLGYALLWGHTPFVLHPAFVVSVPGTALLLPVRLVLWGIRFVEERIASGPFDFSSNHAWIGVVAGALGAGLAAGGLFLVRAAVRLARR